MDHLKVFIEFVIIPRLLFIFFVPEACGILASRPGTEPIPTALEGKVLTTGPLGRPNNGFQDIACAAVKDTDP